MNYYEAKQRKDKSWDYTCSNRRIGVYPIGYCHRWEALTSPPLSEALVNNNHAQEEHARFKEKYHEGGHATQAEAESCYREYLLDKRMVMGEDEGSQRKCQVCGEWTMLRVSVDYSNFDLCAEHRNREELEKLFPPVGTSFSS